jgi:hypothetical protein
MNAITPTTGLDLAYHHVIQHAPAAYLRPGAERNDGNTLQFRWEFPTGGSVSLTVGFDVEQRGARSVATLVPRARVSASIGEHAADALIFAEALRGVVVAAIGAEAVMRQYAYLTGREEEPQAKPT